MDIGRSCRPGTSPAQQLMHTGATPLSLSPTRQLAPAGPAQYPAASPQCREPFQPCHSATQGCPAPQDLHAKTSIATQPVSAQQSHHALEERRGQVMPELCDRLAEAALPAPVAASMAAAVPEAPVQRLPQMAQQQQLARPVASAPAAAQRYSDPTVQPQTSQARFCGNVPPSHEPQMLPDTAVPQTTTNSNDAKPAVTMRGMADAVLPHSRAPPRGQAAAAGPQQGPACSQAGQAQAAAARSSRHGSHDRNRSRDRNASHHRNESHGRNGSNERNGSHGRTGSLDRNGSHDRNVSGTRMSLRSRNPAPDKTRRMASSGSRSGGRVRSALEVKAPAYATR